MLPYYNTCCTKEGCQLVLYVHSSAALRFMNATCLLDPGFDAMDLVTVQWRPNENDSLYFSHRSHWDDTPPDLQQVHCYSDTPEYWSLLMES